jgi:hypothetical protein
MFPREVVQAPVKVSQVPGGILTPADETESRRDRRARAFTNESVWAGTPLRVAVVGQFEVCSRFKPSLRNAQITKDVTL